MTAIRVVVFSLGLGATVALALGLGEFPPTTDPGEFMLLVVYLLPFALYLWLLRTLGGSVFVGLLLLALTGNFLAKVSSTHPGFAAELGFEAFFYPMWTFSIAVVGTIADRIAYARRRQSPGPEASGSRPQAGSKPQ